MIIILYSIQYCTVLCCVLVARGLQTPGTYKQPAGRSFQAEPRRPKLYCTVTLLHVGSTMTPHTVMPLTMTPPEHFCPAHPSGRPFRAGPKRPGTRRGCRPRWARRCSAPCPLSSAATAPAGCGSSPQRPWGARCSPPPNLRGATNMRTRKGALNMGPGRRGENKGQTQDLNLPICVGPQKRLQHLGLY